MKNTRVEKRENTNSVVAVFANSRFKENSLFGILFIWPFLHLSLISLHPAAECTYWHWLSASEFFLMEIDLGQLNNITLNCRRMCGKCELPRRKIVVVKNSDEIAQPTDKFRFWLRCWVRAGASRQNRVICGQMQQQQQLYTTSSDSNTLEQQQHQR